MFTYVVKYEGIDYQKWDRTFRRILQRSMRKAGRELANKGPNSLAYHMKRKYGLYPPNSPLYKKSKGGKSVFYNVGFLRNSPSYEVEPHASGDVYISMAVGFPNNTSHPSGSNIQTIVSSIIKGGTWTPTPAQRKAYWAKVGNGLTKAQRRKMGQGESSSTWTQPPRDFISRHIETADVKSVMDKYISKSIDEAAKQVKVSITLG